MQMRNVSKTVLFPTPLTPMTKLKPGEIETRLS